MVSECGDSMAAVQGLLKKHEALEAELAARAERVKDLSSDGERLLAEGNLHSDALAHRIEALQVRHKINYQFILMKYHFINFYSLLRLQQYYLQSRIFLYFKSFKLTSNKRLLHLFQLGNRLCPKHLVLISIGKI